MTAGHKRTRPIDPSAMRPMRSTLPSISTQRDAVHPARRARGIGHQREQARMRRCPCRRDTIVEAQAVVDLGGQLVDRDLAGLGEVALGQRAGDRLGRRFHSASARLVFVVFCSSTGSCARRPTPGSA